MSNEKSWINPCGLDETVIEKKKISLNDNISNIKNILSRIDILKRKLEDLKETVKTTFPYLNEDALISRRYSFLTPPETKEFREENVYVRAYYILQTNLMAIEELLRQTNEDNEKYSTELQEIRNGFPQLLCKVHRILLFEGFVYNDVTEDKMSKQFKNKESPGKTVKLFIALRQIHSNMEYLKDEINHFFNEELKIEIEQGQLGLKSTDIKNKFIG